LASPARLGRIPKMPKLRVFLITCRRPHLLPRALASLRSQTFTDWVCEVHNDAPDDPEPGRIVRALEDPRLVYLEHESNWGPTRVFNHVFKGGPEPLASLLEDDNWWDPGFLATAVDTIGRHPGASIAWANMRIWREDAEGNWSDTGTTIWPPAPPGASPVVFQPPELIQSFSALHSNGAMVFRPAMFRDAQVPESTPFVSVEQARERAATGSLVLIPEPLAHYALTHQSARGGDRATWLQSELLMAASFLASVPVGDQDLSRLWEMHRSQRPRSTPSLFLAAAALWAPRLLRPARVADWAWFLMGVIRHPRTILRGLQFRSRRAELWLWLLSQTRAKAAKGEPARATVLAKSAYTYRA